MNRLPLLVTFAVGWFLVVAYFVPTAADGAPGTEVAAPMRAVGVVAGLIPTWVSLIGGLALALGAVSLFRIHLGRIARSHPHRGYSVVTLVAMTVTVVVGVVPGDTARLIFDWIYEYVFVPLRGGWKRTVILAVFAFALMSEGGGWLVRFVSPSLAVVKIVGFFGLQVLLALLLAALAVSLARPRPAPNGVRMALRTPPVDTAVTRGPGPQAMPTARGRSGPGTEAPADGI